MSKKTIYCPDCGRKVAEYDGITKSNVYSVCRKCKRQIVYLTDTGETVSKRRSNRTTSSGMSFC
nr:MAG TPA: DNA-directed RNA polymerase [Caudoviricetes sp.]